MQAHVEGKCFYNSIWSRIFFNGGKKEKGSKCRGLFVCLVCGVVGGVGFFVLVFCVFFWCVYFV